MVIQLNRPATLAREALSVELGQFPLYRDEVLKNFDAMLTGLPTPLFDSCTPVKKLVFEILEECR